MRGLTSLVLLAFLLGMGFVEAVENQTRILYIRHGEVPGNSREPESYKYTGCRTGESLTSEGV